MLAFSRRQILEPRSLSLNQTARDVLSLLDKVIGKDIEIKTALADDLAPVPDTGHRPNDCAEAGAR